MYDTYECPPHLRLTLDEVHIVHMNIASGINAPPVSFQEFQLRLENLLRHTPDSCLSASIRSLQEKTRHLSLAEYQQLCEDSITQVLLTTENYQLPSL